MRARLSAVKKVYNALPDLDNLQFKPQLEVEQLTSQIIRLLSTEQEATTKQQEARSSLQDLYVATQIVTTKQTWLSIRFRRLWELQLSRRSLKPTTAPAASGSYAGRPERLKAWQFGHPADAPMQTIVIDASFINNFQDGVTVFETIQQLMNLLKDNTQQPCPCHLVVSSCSGLLKEYVDVVQPLVENATFDSRHVTEIFDTNKLRFLSPDATTTLTHVDSHKIYIIGAIVDKPPLPLLSITAASQHSIPAYRLPITEYCEASGRDLRKDSSHLLSMGEVVDILRVGLQEASVERGIDLGVQRMRFRRKSGWQLNTLTASFGKQGG